MSERTVGEIRIFAGNFAPDGWALCNGQLLSISENEILFSLIGTTYGGDGQSTFALPNLQGRVPIGIGNGYTLSQAGGAETVTLTMNQLPYHTHAANASSQLGNSNSPANGIWAASTINQFAAVAPNSAMNSNILSATGGNQPHNNMMPSVALNFIIALDGLYPSFN